MIEYEVVAKTDVVDLEEEVRKMIAEGWEPQGGIAVIRYEWAIMSTRETGASWTYLQAMVKR